ncbi:hypothetical protein NG800_019095 [Epilithonimonas ginsengisoli]|uniref:Phage P1-related protein n=1 Tax=Epilithonimonas ginsengisoli TaxID=1245592 RepID=A0ABU4JMZ4_9FLAO|nr:MULTISPECIES: hypothetical protein [Chryseobacterium group]MBV6881943.1 hypothetical protein [Epilithonimonas sp. FP105]MDW8551032.1 hypothetical protein [Epilithonimonas ginsengisoli]OAH69932.1 hypothetical protein AXA65_14235 [Chryseobacterium sp. FP211-J200]
MSGVKQLVFPELIFMDEFGNDFTKYFQEVYEIFEKDFVKSIPSFCGVRVSAQKNPLVDGLYHKTFYHITHEGEIENSRTPDFRRMERIRFPRFIIENCPNSELLVWKNTRGRDTRILIFNEEEKYLVVLTERDGFYLLWTAYVVDKTHTYNKLMKEYNAYKKANTA